MSLPPLPLLTEDASADTQALWLWCANLRTSLEDFTPSQVAAALDIGSLGYGPGSPFAGITLPVAAATPDTPTGLQAFGLYRQICLAWDLDVNPNITGWTVQRADDLAFTANVVTLTSARALAFRDEALGDAVTKYYRIRAEGKTASSPFTAVVSATTLAADTTALDVMRGACVYLQRVHLGTAVIDTARIADASILTAKIADLQVTTGKIALLAVTTALIDNLGVTTGKIANLAVTNAKVNDLAADKLTAGTINVLVQLTNQTIKLDGVNSQITITDTQGAPVIRVQIGKLSAGSSDYGLIVYNASGNVMWSSLDSGAQSIGIKDLAIISDKLNDLAVLTGKINTNAVTGRTVYASAGVGFTNSTTTYADTGATATYTVVATGDVEIKAVCNMLVESTTGLPTYDRGIAAIRLVKDGATGSPLRYAGYACNYTGNSGNFIGPVSLYYLDPAVTNGSHTYKIQGAVGNAISRMTIDIVDLTVEELKR